MSIRKPNLFVIGAMKAGTTALCRILREHDQIFMAAVKETFYFTQRYKQMSIADYLEHFDTDRNVRYIAEGTADYAGFPLCEGVAERILTFNPDSRFIYLVRDPLDRAISHYKHFVLQGREENDLLTALRNKPDYLWLSYNAAQLRPYIRCFGREAVWVGSSHRLRENPAEQLLLLFQWLGLDAMHDPVAVNTHANITPNEKVLVNQQSVRVKLAKRLLKFPLLQSVISPVFINYGRQRFAPKKIIDFESDCFLAEVETAREQYGPLFSSWNDELYELLGERLL